jgi:hypothetical protein
MYAVGMTQPTTMNGHFRKQPASTLEAVTIGKRKNCSILDNLGIKLPAGKK